MGAITAPYRCELFPIVGYSSAAEAIDAAIRHPLQAKARAETAKLAGATVTDAYWTDTDQVIRFSNGLLLHVFPTGKEVNWAVTDQLPAIDESEVGRIGAPPVILRWPTTAKYSTGELTMDRTTLAAARIGRKFAEFFVNERGLLVYCRRVLIWCFTAVHDTLQGRTILNVQEDD
jgi:hypothetical protein